MNIKLVIADETKWVAYGQARVLCCYGYNNNATDDRYIQFHAKPAALLANGDVPAVASLYAPANAPFKWEWDKGIPLSELTIAVSSTQTTYTALTNTGLDMTVEVETDFSVSSTTTLVGDLTSADKSSRQIWASASGPKRLLRFDVVNPDVVDVYARISASDSKLTGDTSNLPLKVAASSTKSFFFGRHGIVPFREDADGTEHKGCSIFILASTDPSAGLIPVPNTSIMAIYDN